MKNKNLLKEDIFDKTIDFFMNIMKKTQLDKLKKKAEIERPELADALEKLDKDFKKLNQIWMDNLTDKTIDYDKVSLTGW